MVEAHNNNQDSWHDPDEAPQLSEEWFEAAHQYHGDTLVMKEHNVSELN